MVSDLKTNIEHLLSSQRLAVLSTSRDDGPYASLVAFAAADIRTIFFATSRSTRKYANLATNAAVALLVDDRRNEEEDFHRAMAVTAVGTVAELEGKERAAGAARYLGKHPHLEDFLRSPTCALLAVSVKHYLLVRKFQRVEELIP